MVTLMAITACSGFSYRALRILRAKRRMRENGKEPTRCMVIGAGSAGNEIIKEITTTQYLTMKVCCIIDDGPGCWGKKLRGVPILGGRDLIVQAAAEYNIAEIIFDSRIIATWDGNRKQPTIIVKITSVPASDPLRCSSYLKSAAEGYSGFAICMHIPVS